MTSSRGIVPYRSLVRRRRRRFRRRGTSSAPPDFEAWASKCRNRLAVLIEGAVEGVVVLLGWRTRREGTYRLAETLAEVVIERHRQRLLGRAMFDFLQVQPDVDYDLNLLDLLSFSPAPAADPLNLL